MAIRRQEHNDDYSENDTQVTLDISPNLQHRIRRAIADSDLSVNMYLARILEQNIPQEQGEEIPDQVHRKPITQEVLAQALQAIEEIKQHTQGRFFEEPADIINQMRDERSKEL